MVVIRILSDAIPSRTFDPHQVVQSSSSLSLPKLLDCVSLPVRSLGLGLNPSYQLKSCKSSLLVFIFGSLGRIVQYVCLRLSDLPYCNTGIVFC